MKKSKLVTIGLLAISLASCHHHHHSIHGAVGSYADDPNYYVDNGYGYSMGYPGYPFWMYYSMFYHPYWGVYAGGGYGYRSFSTTHVSSWRVSSGGHTYAAGRGFARGGFGSSGRGAGA